MCVFAGEKDGELAVSIETSEKEAGERRSLLEGLLAGRSSVDGGEEQVPVHMCEFFGDSATKNVSKARLVLSGSFNPLHEGHKELLRQAAQLEGLDPIEDTCFELSIANADKVQFLKKLEHVRRFIYILLNHGLLIPGIVRI